MLEKGSYIRTTIFISFIFFHFISVAHAANLSFSGTIASIEIDTGTGAYTGTQVGDSFTGNITVGNSASDATASGVSLMDGGIPVAYEYEFSGTPYGITLTNGVVNTSSSFSGVEIDNNAPLEVDDINLLNNLFGANLTVADRLDAWAVFGHTDGAVIDMNDNLIDGIEFGFIFLLENTHYNGLDYQAAPPPLTEVAYPVFYIAENDAAGSTIFFAIGVLDSVTQIQGSVSSVSVWLNRTHNETSNETTYAFYTDVYGTISEFKSIVVTTPLGASHNLGLSPEGDQWGSGIEGSQTDIESQFPDGTYTFNVTYNDDSTEQITVELGGEFPPYPENVALNNTEATWDAWTNPAPSSEIELIVSENNGDFIEGNSSLPTTATSYSLTSNLTLDSVSYNLEVSFATEVLPAAYKSTSTIITTAAPSTDNKPTTGDGGGGGGSVHFGFLLILLIGVMSHQVRGVRI
ncbi:hypothetical protein [Kaarinaea lacus]